MTTDEKKRAGKKKASKKKKPAAPKKPAKATKAKAKAKSEEEERHTYEPPLIQRIDLPGLSNDVLDDAGTPLLAQESSNVNPATLFPPPPTPP